MDTKITGREGDGRGIGRGGDSGIEEDIEENWRYEDRRRNMEWMHKGKRKRRTIKRFKGP